MATRTTRWTGLLVVSTGLGVSAATVGCGAGAGTGASHHGVSGKYTQLPDAFLDEPDPSPQPGLIGEHNIDFDEMMKRLKAGKPAVMKRQQRLLEARYDLSDRPSREMMFRKKPLQSGVRARLPEGLTFQTLAGMSPEQIREDDLFPAAFFPLPHPHHEAGGMVFPKNLIDETKRQTGRDLTRFDLDFDIPEHFLPEFPPPVFLTTRPDLGDVSQGKLITTDNFFEIFKGIIHSKDLDGLRLLVTPFPQQQFNLTDDRRSERPSTGVACFDCHSNGSTSGATHPALDARPQQFRHRVDTPTLRGVNVQRLFGSQRALKSVEDFTEFEQRGAYFDGDIASAAKKGVNVLERGSQVSNMADFQDILDFPPAPKLDPITGKLDPKKASPEELRGQEVFFGKGQCGTCHTPPHYTDNTMHDLKVERFFTPRMINGRMASQDGPIKTFPLRGIRETPPYLHDGRLLTLEDAIEFFNLVVQARLTEEEKKDLLAFLLAL